MNNNYPVYTLNNECHDCYKCIRHCPTKAIKIKDGRASVIPDLCVTCGICVKVCPAEAKKIRDDTSYVKSLLKTKDKIIAALAPSWHSAFKGVNKNQLIKALKSLGFYAVSEVALGAEAVSKETYAYLAKAQKNIHISSACPVVVEFIKKYMPEHTLRITPLLSPALTNAKIIKEHFDPAAKIVFFGPCAAKKHESARFPELISAVLTFKNLNEWLRDNNISLHETAENDDFIPEAAEKGNFYALEGGMLETLRKEKEKKINFFSVSGLKNIKRLFNDPDLNNINSNIFIEALGCEGGCINGPGMPESSGQITDVISVIKAATADNKQKNNYPVKIEEQINREFLHKKNFSQADIKEELAKIGKFTDADELNCGGCGYESCKTFARAVLEDKAEHAMCLSYLKKLAQKKSNALIKYIPAGVVIADKNLNIIECNEQFSKLFDDSTRLAYAVSPGLLGIPLEPIIDFSYLLKESLETAKDIIKNNYCYSDRIYNLSIFNVDPGQIVGAVIQDVTDSELKLEQISTRAQTVIRKNIITVQTIANYLGEHMAETESLLRDVAKGFNRTDKRNKRA